MRVLGRLRRAAALAGVGGIALAGSVMLTAAPAAAAGSAVRSPAPTGQPVRHPNVRNTHSPKLLRQLAGGSGSSTPGQLAPAAPAEAIAGALQGVDVASFQEQSPISWPQVASAGIQFAAIKATEGDYYTNKYALNDLVNAKAAGLSVLAYAYAIPDGDGDTRGAGVGHHARAAREDDLREGGREHHQGYGRDRELPAGQG